MRLKRFVLFLDSIRFIHERLTNAWGSVMMLQMPQKNECKGCLRKIKLVYKGTKEYKQAKRQQALHAEVHNHVQKRLCGGLMEAEMKAIREHVHGEEN